MHQNAIFLHRLTAELQKALKGDILFDCFSVSKEEIYFIFGRGCVKASFFNGQMFLEFPEEDHLPSKNRQVQFRELHKSEVREVKQHPLNRSFFIGFGEQMLVFKCYGRNSNIIWFKGDDALDIFRQNLSADMDLEPADFDSGLDSISDLGEEFSSVDEMAAQHRFVSEDFIEFLNSCSGSLKDRLEALQVVVSEAPIGLFTKENGKYAIAFDGLVKEHVFSETYNTALDALHSYSRKHLQKERFEQVQKGLLTDLKRKLNKNFKKSDKLAQDLSKLENRTPYYQIADVVMANLHQIEEGTEKVKLLNFYNNEWLTIPLKKDLSPQKNAEKFYKKGKNADKELHQIKSLIEQVKNEIEELESQIEEVQSAERLKELSKWKKRREAEAQNESDPFRVFEFKGYTIWVGKSSNNNYLLLKKSHKDDIWLHARNVAGSHTIIRKHSPDGLPNAVLEHAAALAAYYSKSRNESLAEVIYTERKYVRKFKGAAAGQVKVEKESVILVEPLRRS